MGREPIVENKTEKMEIEMETGFLQQPIGIMNQGWI